VLCLPAIAPESRDPQVLRIACLPRLRFRSVSWLGGLSNLIEPSSMTLNISAAFPSQVEIAIPHDSKRTTVTRAENVRLTVARRRRFFTVFPCAESPVIVDGGHASSAARRLRR
jgi:hypothetical protein